MGEHSGPYETQHPNATRDEQIEQAGQILARLAQGQSTRSVAAAMGINRSTLYARIKMINQPLPDVDVVRVIHFERLEELYEGLRDRTESDDATNADYARLVAEQRQVLARQSALLRVEGSDTPPPAEEPDEQMTEWVAAARAESETELEKVRSDDYRDAS